MSKQSEAFKPFELTKDHINENGTIKVGGADGVPEGTKDISIKGLDVTKLDLSGLAQSISVFIFGCPKLTEVDGGQVGKLMAFDCPALSKVNTQSQSVSIGRCNELKTIEGNTENLGILSCPKLETLPDTKNLLIQDHQGPALPALPAATSNVNLVLIDTPNIEKLPRQVAAVNLDQSGIKNEQQKEKLMEGKIPLQKKKEEENKDNAANKETQEFIANNSKGAEQNTGREQDNKPKKEEEKNPLLELATKIIDTVIAVLNMAIAILNFFTKLLGGTPMDSISRSGGKSEDRSPELTADIEANHKVLTGFLEACGFLGKENGAEKGSGIMQGFERMLTKGQERAQGMVKEAEKEAAKNPTEEIKPKQIFEKIAESNKQEAFKQEHSKKMEASGIFKDIEKLNKDKEEHKDKEEQAVEKSNESLQQENKLVTTGDQKKADDDKKQFDKVINQMKNVFKSAGTNMEDVRDGAKHSAGTSKQTTGKGNEMV